MSELKMILGAYINKQNFDILDLQEWWNLNYSYLNFGSKVIWRILRNSDVSTLSIAIDSGNDILPFLFTYVLLWELCRMAFSINVFMYLCIELVPTEFNLLKNNLILNILIFAYNLLLIPTNSYAFLPCKIWFGVQYEHSGKWMKIFT